MIQVEGYITMRTMVEEALVDETRIVHVHLLNGREEQICTRNGSAKRGNSLYLTTAMFTTSTANRDQGGTFSASCWTITHSQILRLSLHVIVKETVEKLDVHYLMCYLDLWYCIILIYDMWYMICSLWYEFDVNFWFEYDVNVVIWNCDVKFVIWNCELWYM